MRCSRLISQTNKNKCENNYTFTIQKPNHTAKLSKWKIEHV